MVNLLGGAQPDSHLRAAFVAKTIPMARVHLYGKGDARPGRKMGHVTVLASSARELEDRVKPLVDFIDRMQAEKENSPSLTPAVSRTETGNYVGKGSDLPSSQNPTLKNLPSRQTPLSTPLVAITMGSDSDRFVLADAIDVLDILQIPYFVTITSAHRTPELMTAFAKEAASRGFKVIIAAAGGAAHLPGMIAALTVLPVIGVPVKGKTLDGMDSLLSIVQMPVRLTLFYSRSGFTTDRDQNGCDVATVGINRSTNAALLAARMLALSDIQIRKRLCHYLESQTKSVTEKAERMERVGFEAYGSIESKSK